MNSRPVVVVTSCNRLLGDHWYHIAGRKYVDAVRLAGALPLVSPPVAADELDALLDVADGVLLTGSPSNVHPAHFGQTVHDATLPLDADRDAWTLPLARLALARGVPLFAICRGTQEVNVALGGSLHQAVHEQPGLADHRDSADTPEAAYAPAHGVRVVAGGVLAAALGDALGDEHGGGGGDGVSAFDAFDVNSLHGQGIRRLADGLRVEATAPDGLVEAFSLPSAPAFNLCVQWHPEWRAADNPVSMRLFAAFGAAVRRRADGRHPQPAGGGEQRR